MGSIDHFHHQLQLLEHAGPKTVAPAYRLHTAMPGRPAETSTPAVDSSRPKLVLLRPTDDGPRPTSTTATAATTSGSASSIGRSPSACPKMSADLSAFRREQAKRRCTTLLRCLCGIAISTALIGMWPAMHLAWVLTVLSGLAALGLVGLMAYAKEIQAEQRRRRVRQDSARGPFGGGGHVDAATAGYPGAWDDADYDSDSDYEEPRVAAR